ncbi:MAG: replication initiation factor domain-containing protein [Candidatus Binatia bacterium]
MSTTEAAARSADAQGARSAPRAVTRGEENAAKVDWLNATFPQPSMSWPGLIALLARMLGRPITGVEGGGLLGFESTVKLEAHHGRERSAIGFLAFGGESQNGRWLLSLTGVGCGFVRDWEAIADLLESLEARITRLDLAVDFLDGEHTVEHVLDWYQAGGFAFPGKTGPKSKLAGDWLGERDGRTVYVGKSENGKSCRAYEKGRQLGDPESQWLRIEVQYGNRDRVIPFSALIERDAFFAGAYPVLESLISAAAQSIPTSRAKAKTSMAHLLFHLKRCYGKVVHAAVEYFGATDAAELVEEVRVIGLPRRLDYSGAAAGVPWADVLAQVRRKTQ